MSTHRLEAAIDSAVRSGASSPLVLQQRERARDAQRRNELQDGGTRVYEYTWDDVTQRQSYVVRTLTTRLHQVGWRR